VKTQALMVLGENSSTYGRLLTANSGMCCSAEVSLPLSRIVAR